jgi:hypothetical protein
LKPCSAWQTNSAAGSHDTGVRLFSARSVAGAKLSRGRGFGTLLGDGLTEGGAPVIALSLDGRYGTRVSIVSSAPG